MSDRASYIVAPVRTAIGKFGGSFVDTPAAELGGFAARETLKRSGIDPKLVGEVIIGHGRQGGNRPNPARQVQWKAGIPQETPAYTVNKACASSLKAITLAAGAIRLGEQEVVLAGGQENMSRTPFFLEKARWGYRLGHAEITDGMYLDGFMCPLCNELMGATAENLAVKYSLSRDDQDRYAVETQRRCAEATKAGKFKEEIAPVEVSGRKGPVKVEVDEHPRADATIEGMRKLPPVFKKDGTVHAGNSSGITDGAATMLVASGDAVKAHGLVPEARVVDWTVAGVDPSIMGIGPVPAVRALLARNHLTMGDIDLIELNEAFAAQALAVADELGLDLARTNIDGGALALGHPLGATGARITGKAAALLQRENKQFALATQCIGGGQGIATILEAVR